MPVLSLNGIDGSGKTEQISLLKWRMGNFFHFTEPISSYSAKWPNMDPISSSQWWFQEVSMEDLISLFIESLNARVKDIRPEAITVFDRGERMFKAVCAATWATRENITIDEALEFVDSRFQSGLDKTERETEVLFRPDSVYALSVSRYLKIVSNRPVRPDWMNERYAVYQQKLAQAMALLYENTPPAFTVDVSGCAVEIHNKLSQKISQAFDCSCLPILEHVRLLVGLGGYSESGKSSCADLLSREAGFARLKFRFFAWYLRQFGREPTSQAISYEVLRFLEAHPLELFTIESLHGFGASAYLKILLGDRYKVLFLDAPRSLRIERCAKLHGIDEQSAAREVESKDCIKKSSGIETVRELADVQVDNSGQPLTAGYLMEKLLGKNQR